MANLNLSEFGEKLFVADADHTFIWDTANAISKRVSRNSWLNSGTLTSDAPVTISQTWGGTGSTAFTALKVNATTTTGSAATAKILELQHSSLDRFSVQKDGVTTIGASDAGSATQMLNLVNQYGSVGFLIGGGGRLGFFAGYEHISFFNSGILTLNSSTSHLGIGPNVILARDGADNTLALRNGAAAQTFRVYNTYSNAGADTEYIQISATSSGHRIGTNSSGTGVSRALLLGSGGGSQWNINTSGHLGTFGSDNLYDIGASGANRPRNVYVGTSLFTGAGGINFDINARLRSPATDVITLYNNGLSDFNRLQFGGTTASFPAIKRNAAGLQIRLADDSANTTLEAGNIYSTGNVGIGTTAPSSKLHVAETWNAAGTTFCAIKSVITDTSSAAGSNFLELYSGSATQPLKLDINKTGQLNIYGTWTDTTNYERLSLRASSGVNAVIGTNKGSGGGLAVGLEFHTDGTKRVEIQPTGNVVVSNSVTVNGNITTGYMHRLSALTVATLPAATGQHFPTIAGVTDSTVTAAAGKGNTVAGGGSNKVIVMSDGTNWVIL